MSARRPASPTAASATSAHRSLDRFQAEHWDTAQWEREIDWALKKRLNLIMLRIGMDDVYQKAFPGIVPYPPSDAPLPEAVARSYDDRTSAWPLQYRASSASTSCSTRARPRRMHPEDTGTMTHWYSRTPQSFLDAVKPSLMPQAGCLPGQSHRRGLGHPRRCQPRQLLAADAGAHRGVRCPSCSIRSDWRRKVFTNRADNLEIKLYAYRRIIEKLREHYPQAPLLIASWDFYYPGWPGEDVAALTQLLNPQNTLIFDYTSDAAGA